MDKAYIVANEEQEREVLEQFETKGYVWLNKGIKPTEWFPSHIEHLIEFPYVLLGDGTVSWEYMYELEDEEIVYDGRKEEKMSDKYVVTQEFMNELEEWRDANHLDHTHINGGDLLRLPTFILNFWLELGISQNEANNRLIAIIRWVNGEDVFEVEKPKKWVVRSKEHDEGGHYQYVIAGYFDMSFNEYHIEHATRFDTEEEAQSWANSHQEVVQVEMEE